ncbi:MAG TPA: hypothetical protein VEI97_20370, partial [bacterium]|nr:hypothetical protein [bacterium]
MTRYSVAPLVASLLALVALGCSGSSPSTPDPTDARPSSQTAPAEGALPAGVAGLGGFRAVLHPSTLSAEVAPWRTTVAVGDVFNEIGVTDALRGFNAFHVRGLRLVDADTIGVAVEVRHPFPLDRRPDLSLFNLKIHVVTQGIDQFGPLAANAGFLENADGYSTIWDLQAEKDRATLANLHPYRILSDDPTRPATFDHFAPAGFNVWAPGSVHSDELLLHLPEPGDTAIDVYLTADYGQAATRQTRFTPEYDLPRFAGKAPWKIDVVVRENTLA